MERTEEVVIVGGGIAGLATAVGLKRVGVQALVLETAHELRATGAALTLFPNAWSALHALGVAPKLAPFYPPLSGACVTNVATGAVTTGILSTDNGGNRGPRAVHRKALLEALAGELPEDSIRFSSKLSAIEIEQRQGDSSVVVLRLNDGVTVKSKVVIGCDGVHSVVAKWVGLSTPIESGRSGIRGLSHFPEGHNLNQHLQQFVDVGRRGGFIPLNHTDVYWFFVSSQEEETRYPQLIQKQVLENYANDFPSQFKEIVKHTDLSSLTWAPLMLRQPWKLIFGKLSKGNVTVCGDAMHPMTPDLGQGGCSSLEDAVVLTRHVGNSVIRNNGRIVTEEMTETLNRYVEERRCRAATLITASYLSGWIQQGGSSWWMKLLRDVIFYPFLARRFFNVADYDCGTLPSVSNLHANID